MRVSKKATERIKQSDPAKLTMGQRIRLIRDNKTQTAFGAILGKSQDAISVYETNQVVPSLKTLAKIAEMGNVTVDWLYHGHSHKGNEHSFTINGHIIKPKTPEWTILGKVIDIRDKKVKEKLVELVNSFIKIEQKGKV